MRAEIPLDYNSGDPETYVKTYRNADVGRSQRWKNNDIKVEILLSYTDYFL